jgi:uncharacterized protein
MKFLFHLGHPAHFHLFKHVIASLKVNGHETYILIKKKDVLEDLLIESNLKYWNILPYGRKNTKLGIAWGQIKQDVKLINFALKHKPNLMIGTSVAISHAGKFLGIPSINVNEDDADVVPLYAKLAYPWASCIIAPNCCSVGKWEEKKVSYNSFHELAYLHPNHFEPKETIVNRYFPSNQNYFIIRFAQLNAHHDKGINGINGKLTEQIIDKLRAHGNIYITSERVLEPSFEPYRMKIRATDMHHVLAFAQLYIGDSQTMAAEAGVLGVPYIRFNDFVGRISYLNEIENKYKLGYGVLSSNPELMFEKLDYLINLKNRRQIFQERKTKMLSEKIDTAKFLIWFLENYPNSIEVLKNTPEYQFRFI